MTSRRAFGLLLAALLALGWAADELEDCATCPQVELEREGKPIVAVKTSPDDVSDVFVIEYLDVLIDTLTTFDPEGRTATVGEAAFWWDAASQVEEGLKTGALVWATYNGDRAAAAGRAYLVELRRYDGEARGKHPLHRFIIYDPAPYRTLVRFGEDARAYGHLASVERVKDVYERIALGDGEARYLADEDRFEVRFEDVDEAVEIAQGKSRAWGRRLDYDNDRGEATLSGPVRLERPGEKPLAGRAERLRYDVDDETLTLTGGVRLEQDGRVTTATSARIVEREGYAYLYGDPVVSTGADGEVRGRAVRYDLETGELVVLEAVKATFEDAR